MSQTHCKEEGNTAMIPTIQADAVRTWTPFEDECVGTLEAKVVTRLQCEALDIVLDACADSDFPVATQTAVRRLDCVMKAGRVLDVVAIVTVRFGWRYAKFVARFSPLEDGVRVIEGVEMVYSTFEGGLRPRYSSSREG